MAIWARTLEWVKKFYVTDRNTADAVKNCVLKELEAHVGELRALDAERVAAGLAPWHQTEIDRLSSLVIRVRHRLEFADSLPESKPTQTCVFI